MFIVVLSSILLNKQMLTNFDLINSFRFTQNITHIWNSENGFVIAFIPYLFWTIFILLLFYLILSVSNHKIFHALCFAASICTMVIMFFSPTIYASGPRTLVVGSVLLIIIGVTLIQEYKLIGNKLSVIIFCCLPFLNFLQLYIIW